MGALLGGYALPVAFIRGDLYSMPVRQKGYTGDATFMIGSVTNFFMPASRHKDHEESWKMRLKLAP